MKIEILGKPIPLQRPRLSKKVVFDPQTSQKEATKWLMRSQYRERPMNGEISLSLTFVFEPSKSSPKWAREEKIWKFIKGKPDLDNLIKFVLDCGNGILWEDDAQIVRIFNTTKIYGETAKTVISFTENYE